MPLSDKFQFSQSSLQDYIDCYRRFQLRYLDKLVWPAFESDPVLIMEQKMELGSRFHKMVQRHQIGVPALRLTQMINDPTLAKWWQNYLENPLPAMEGNKYPEITLAAKISGHRLVAKLDLLIVQPGEKAVIIDWKTSEKLPRREHLENRIQTRVYRFVLVEAGRQYNAQEPINPEMAEMIFWYPEHPEFPQRFPYSTEQYEEDKTFLEGVIHEINERKVDEFTKTEDLHFCKYCRYRSLCDRGITAGDISEMTEIKEDDDFDIILDIEQIGEIAF